MDQKTAEFFVECEEIIEKAYAESGPTMEEAEKHAARFLHAGIKAADALRTADLDARMKKAGQKAIEAKVYIECASPGPDGKKPTVDMINALVNQNTLFQKATDARDTAEVKRDQLTHYLDIFREAHVYFRGIAKGSFSA